MKTHNYVFIQILWYIFLFTTLFKLVASFQKKVNDLYEQSSLCILSAVSAYRNPWLLLPGLNIATVSVTFGTKFPPFMTKTSSAVATLRPVFT